MYVGAYQLPRHDHIVLHALRLAESQFWIAIFVALLNNVPGCIGGRSMS